VNGNELADRPDLWILPWLPHFAAVNDKTIIPTLVADCKRKMKSALSFLQKSIPSDDNESFLRACIQALRPWRGIFKKDTMQQTLVSTFVTPRLAQYLARCKIIIHSDDNNCEKSTTVATESFDPQQGTAVDFPFQMHSLGLLSDLEFVSVLEGELLPHWAIALHEFIISEKARDKSGIAAARVVAESYKTWKLRFFGSSSEQDASSTSLQLVQNDGIICRCFYTVLLQIQAVSSSDPAIDELCPEHSNYRTVLARRKAEAKREAADDLLRMEELGDANGIEARVRLNRNGHVPTFREVVEEYARERDILFQPRMGGGNTTKDGKQVFLFGKVPIYLDANVAYAWQGAASGEWQPMSLDAIVQKALSSNNN
jgi:hypothetical protein